LGLSLTEIFNLFVIADIPGIIEGAAEGKDWDIIFYVILNVITLCLFVPVDTPDIKENMIFW
jgi:GTPase involved in cell partitioning and DNA repair